ncbi:type A chloramphenicol O-acetyltransferase [Huaxiibacter chinensis]
MKKTTPEYTSVDLSRWARKEHFEVFQSFAQSTINQTVEIDITALLKHIKEVGWKFYPTMIFLLSKIVNRHSEFRMAMKNNELIIWNEVHPSYTIFHHETETFSSLWSHYDGNIHHFQNVYAEDIARYGNVLSYWPKEESRENIFFVSAIPWVTFTSFNINVANMQNFFAPMFTFGKYVKRDEKVLLPLAVQVHHSVCDGFHLARLFNELQELCDGIQNQSEALNA